LLIKGDILLGDRAYGEYTTVAGLPRQGVDVVARLHQRRKVDFRKARRLGENDGLFQWSKGYQQSEILSATPWALLPAQITVRILRFTATIRGFRGRRVTLVTTLLDPRRSTALKARSTCPRPIDSQQLARHRSLLTNRLVNTLSLPSEIRIERADDNAGVGRPCAMEPNETQPVER
jgi:hypothetical protein